MKRLLYHLRMIRPSLGVLGCLILAGVGCSDDSQTASDAASPDVGAPSDGASSADTSAIADAGGSDVIAPPDGSAGLPKGWLFTNKSKIYVSDGAGSGTPWMGRGFNIDDIFFCGYNSTLWMSNPGTEMTTFVNTAVTTWKPTFLRFSISMNSYAKTSWTSNPAQYKTPMTAVIDSVSGFPGVYALVTLRSDVTMTCADDATCVPTNATDATYTALVDTFANSSFVLFGISNEPGGNSVPIATIAAAMDHAVSVIRKEEDKLGVPHHIVSVQGTDWTSSIGYYASKPLAYDNVVYEVHGYPPLPASYTYPNLPVILGEYGTLSDSNAFYADIESKQIPNLAWDLQPYSGCQPDLLTVNHSPTNLVPTAWGSTVKAYLAAH